MEKLRTVFIVVCSTLFALSCADKEGVVDTPQNAPLLLTAGVLPTSVHLDSDRVFVEPLTDDRYRVSITISTEAIDGDGGNDISNSTYTIISPRSSLPLASGTLPRGSTLGDTARFGGSVTFEMKRSDAGVLSIRIQTVDNANLASNVLGRSFVARRTNSRPRLSNLVAPDTVTKPTTGTVLFTFAVTASDSDGYGDISDVSFYAIFPPPPSGAIPLFDNGNRDNGDERAGDGVFSRIVSITPQNTTGEKRVVFLARDRFGAMSDSLPHTFYVVD